MGSTNPGSAPSTPVRKAPIAVREDEDDSRARGGGGHGGDEDEDLDVSTASAAAPDNAAIGTPPRNPAPLEPVASGAASLSKASIDQLHKALESVKIPRAELTVNSEVLGQGAFGVVFSG